LIEISKLKNEEEMKTIIENIKERGLKREDTRDLTKLLKGKELEKKKPKHYVFNYSPKDDKSYSVRIEFKKESVSRQEIISILEDLLAKLKLHQ
jgi:ParB family chromosome partitioning protein